jgi:cation/acetate symporter
MRELNYTAIILFVLFVVATLYISYWASQRTRTRSDFYTAGGNITPLQNGVAIAGDFMSAAAFLGLTALFYVGFVDAMVIGIGALAGWPLMMFLFAERIRNLGRFTFIDVVSARLEEKPIRLVLALASIFIILSYLVAQMVAAGKLIEVLFGLSYETAVLVIGVLVVIYVLYGGMLATTWVQIVKATLLIVGVTAMLALLLVRIEFNVGSLVDMVVEVHPGGDSAIEFGRLFPGLQVLTVAASMMFGTLGLPHVLMRLFTVRDGVAARQSVLVASAVMGYFFLILPLIGLAGIVYVLTNSNYFFEGELIGGSNMVAVHLAHALGGSLLMGFVAAVAFATILAVVAGLTVAGSAAIAHDLYARVYCSGNANPDTELKITRRATLAIGILSILLGIAFQHQNVAFIASMPMVVAASTNFPILFLAMFWQGLTTRGAVAGALLGLVSSVCFIVMSELVWVDLLGFDSPLFPYTYPGLFSMLLALIATWLVSINDQSARSRVDRECFAALSVRAELGLGH